MHTPEDAFSNSVEPPLPGSDMRIVRTPDALSITIPVRKKWFAIIIKCVWLTGWLVGEVMALFVVVGSLVSLAMPPPFLLIWSIGWTIGGIWVIRWLVWEFEGKEQILVEREVLTLEKTGAGYLRVKAFHLHAVQHLGLYVVDKDDWFGPRYPSEFKIGQTGVLQFKYGDDTIRFAHQVDTHEAEEILRCIRETGWLTPPGG
jgi:hypothetical protein